MHIYLGSDHGGYDLKEYLKGTLAAEGYRITDCGSYNTESTDYPDLAAATARAVQEKPGSYGILVCRSGEGMEMAANKLSGIRAALVWRQDVAEETRRDNDANILVLPADFINNDEGLAITKTFLNTAFSGEERHVRRLEKLRNLEQRGHDS